MSYLVPWLDRTVDDGAVELGRWPALDAAFAELNAAGFVARQDCWCCARCGHAAVHKLADTKPRGYVFYHAQDLERLERGEPAALCYGSWGKPGDAAVAATVADVLSRHGIRPSARGRLLYISIMPSGHMLPCASRESC